MKELDEFVRLLFLLFFVVSVVLIVTIGLVVFLRSHGLLSHVVPSRGHVFRAIIWRNGFIVVPLSLKEAIAILACYNPY